MQRDLRKRLFSALILIVLIFLVGTFGFFVLLDNLTILDSFYFTVITLTTVGYGDISPHSHMPEGANPYVIKIFTVCLILFGMGSVLNAATIVGEYLFSGEMGRERRRKKMARLIAAQRGHIIICGAGRTGIYIIDELSKTSRPFVIVEQSEERIRELQVEYKDLLYVQGDSTDDTNIKAAGLEHAGGIAAALPDEKDNLFLVIAMSEKKKKEGSAFRIVAKVTNYDKTAPKVRGAGADVVISPSFISARRMVSEMFRPALTTFLDRMLRDDRAVMRIEEVTVSGDSSINDVSLNTARIPHKTGLVVIALRRQGKGAFIYNPRAEERLAAGDVLMVMGDMRKVLKLRELAEGKTQ